MQRASLIGGLAAVAIATSVVGAATVQAATPAATFALAPKDAGGPVHLTKTKHYDDGSTTYTFEGTITSHPNSGIVYLVNTGNAGTSGAQLTSTSYMSGYNKPLFKGHVTLVQSHGTWIERERGGALCRDSVGTFVHQAAYAVTLLSADTAHCDWLDTATVRASVALYNRLP